MVLGHNPMMKKGDVTCPECHAGFRRIELSSRRGIVGQYRCPLCQLCWRLSTDPPKLPIA